MDFIVGSLAPFRAGQPEMLAPEISFHVFHGCTFSLTSPVRKLMKTAEQEYSCANDRFCGTTWYDSSMVT